MKLLQFTEGQQANVIGARRVFNQSMTAMAASVAVNDASSFLGNAIGIPLDGWRRIDGRTQAIARSRLVLFNRLAAASTITVSLADVVNFYPQVSDSGDVLVTMDGRNAAKGDQAITKYVGTPVPLLNSVAEFGWRQMEVIRKGGGQLDTVSIANSQRRVAEELENMVLNGRPSINVGGDTIYGLRTLPSRNTFTHGLTLATATGAQWLAAVKQAIAAALGDNNYGRITLFVNQGDYTAADTTDYAANYAGTILERLRSIGQIAEIVPAPSVPANEILGIVDLDVGEWGGILSAMPMTTQPDTRISMTDNYVFKVWAACAPQFRSDYNGQSQFIHGTQA